MQFAEGARVAKEIIGTGYGSGTGLFCREVGTGGSILNDYRAPLAKIRSGIPWCSLARRVGLFEYGIKQKLFVGVSGVGLFLLVLPGV